MTVHVFRSSQPSAGQVQLFFHDHLTPANDDVSHNLKQMGTFPKNHSCVWNDISNELRKMPWKSFQIKWQVNK